MSTTFSASFALDLASSSPSSDFQEILANRPDLFDFEDEGEGARFLFTISNEDAAFRLAAETAALADKFGLVVIEESRGWTAIEPLPELWDSFPGAHRRWSANTTCNEDECDGQPVFEINSIDVTDQHQLASMQGYEGWRVEIERSPPLITFIRERRAPMQKQS